MAALRAVRAYRCLSDSTESVTAGSRQLLTIRGTYDFRGSEFGFTAKLFVSIPARTVSFEPSKKFWSGGTQPNWIQTADLNGDGNLDLVVTNKGSRNLVVFMGDGHGSFERKHVYPAGTQTYPAGVAIGDFNNDGKPDLIVMNALVGLAGGTVSLFINNGDGSFQNPVNFNTGTAPLSIAVADLNHDGNLGLWIGGNGTGSVMLGNGDGTFQTAVVYNTNTALGVAIADVNKDGNPDLIATNWEDNSVLVFLGIGNGTFQPAQSFPVMLDEPNSVAVGDFNHDENPDLVVTDYDSNGMSLFLGNGDGTFQSPQLFYAGEDPVWAGVANFGDPATQDLVVTAFNGGGVNIFLNPGMAQFGPSVFLATGKNPTFAVTADFNNDGALDVAVVNYGDNTVSVFLNAR